MCVNLIQFCPFPQHIALGQWVLSSGKQDGGVITMVPPYSDMRTMWDHLGKYGIDSGRTGFKVRTTSRDSIIARLFDMCVMGSRLI